jgi:hypothetical protein
MESDQSIPFVDAHDMLVQAPPGAVWEALLEDSAPTVGPAAPLTTLLACDPARGDGGDLSSAGSALPGFRVSAVERQRRLELAGRHRFSRYRLVFVLEPVGELSCRVSAQTWAEFPGIAGRIYGALIVGTHSHALVVRSLLAGVRRRATVAR